MSRIDLDLSCLNCRLGIRMCSSFRVRNSTLCDRHLEINAKWVYNHSLCLFYEDARDLICGYRDRFELVLRVEFSELNDVRKDRLVRITVFLF